ncbi:MAG TPA: hypothetical protein VF838_00965 [Trebonia sp.]
MTQASYAMNGPTTAGKQTVVGEASQRPEAQTTAFPVAEAQSLTSGG